MTETVFEGYLIGMKNNRTIYPEFEGQTLFVPGEELRWSSMSGTSRTLPSIYSETYAKRCLANPYRREGDLRDWSNNGQVVGRFTQEQVIKKVKVIEVGE